MKDLAKEFGRNTDPVYRQEIVKHYILSELTRLPPSARASSGKPASRDRAARS